MHDTMHFQLLPTSQFMALYWEGRDKYALARCLTQTLAPLSIREVLSAEVT